jgi:hypothetical protein
MLGGRELRLKNAWGLALQRKKIWILPFLRVCSFRSLSCQEFVFPTFIMALDITFVYVLGPVERICQSLNRIHDTCSKKFDNLEIKIIHLNLKILIIFFKF